MITFYFGQVLIPARLATEAQAPMMMNDKAKLAATVCAAIL
jgi:hypothetical protein